MPGTPLTPEQRAALEQRIANLKAQQAAAAAAGSSSGGMSNPAAAHAQQQQHHQVQQRQYPYQQQQQHRPPVRGYDHANSNRDNYYYDDHAGEDDEHYDAVEEAFLDAMDAGGHGGGTATAGGPADIGPGSTVATTAADFARARELGDFELLRLAKMGDAVSFAAFAAVTGTDPAVFLDNKEANALHYAADAGSLPLLGLLAGGHHVPYRANDRGMTPLDVAVLTGQPPAVLEAIVAIAAAQEHPDGAAGSGRGFEELLERFAPAPPKFVMSKPAPSVGATATRHTFWSSAAAPWARAAATAAPAGLTVTVTAAGAAISAEAVAAAQGTIQAAYAARNAACGCSGALAPFDDAAARLADTRGLTLVTAAENSDDGSSVQCGALVARGLGGSIVGAGKLCGLIPAGAAPSVADHLSVLPGHDAAGLPAALMSALGASLVAAAPAAVVAFTVAGLLSTPPAATCMVKWYRRATDAQAVFGDYRLASALFPDYYKYDETLRADCVLKGAVPTAMVARHAGLLPGWSEVDAADATQMAIVRQFLREKTAATGAELYYSPLPDKGDNDNDDGLCCGGLFSAGVHLFVRVDAASVAPLDLVAFRIRTSSSNSSGVTVAEVVYATFTALKGTDKAEHVLLIAKELLQTAAVLCPGTFGFAEGDLVKANFDELPAAREFAYVLYSRDGVVKAAPAVPAAKLSLPLLML